MTTTSLAVQPVDVPGSKQADQPSAGEISGAWWQRWCTEVQWANCGSLAVIALAFGVAIDRRWRLVGELSDDKYPQAVCGQSHQPRLDGNLDSGTPQRGEVRDCGVHSGIPATAHRLSLRSAAALFAGTPTVASPFKYPSEVRNSSICRSTRACHGESGKGAARR